MQKQIVEAVALKKKERAIDISRLTTYPEYYAFKEEVESVIKKLESIESIDLESKIGIEVQLLANLQAKKAFVGLLSTLGAYSNKSQVVDKTYS